MSTHHRLRRYIVYKIYRNTSYLPKVSLPPLSHCFGFRLIVSNKSNTCSTQLLHSKNSTKRHYTGVHASFNAINVAYIFCRRHFAFVSRFTDLQKECVGRARRWCSEDDLRLSICVPVYRGGYHIYALCCRTRL